MKNSMMKRICDGLKEISAQQRNPFTKENRVLLLCTADPDMEPRELAEAYNIRFGNETLNGDKIIRIFRQCRIANPHERKELLAYANDYAASLLHALSGGAGQLEIPTAHPQFKRMVLLSMLRQSKQVAESSASEYIIRMNKDFSRESFDFILEQLHTQAASAKSSEEQEISALSASLERTKKLLHDMQESFDTQLEESRLEAEEDFISKLNSAEYGYILDQMAAASEGFRNMRAKHIRVPVEIRSMQTLVRRLSEFIEDCGVTEMMECDMHLRVTAEQAGAYQYEGTPFSSQAQVKLVEIISPGWEIKDRGIIIAQPRIREIKEEN